MRSLGNIVWHFPYLGFITASITYLFGLLLTLTVIASPLGLGLMELGKFYFLPYSKALVPKSKLETDETEDSKAKQAWKVYSTIVMIIYVLTAGWMLALILAIQTAIAFITIIGIPAAIASAKGLSTVFNPVGKKCVSQSVAEEIRKREAENKVDQIRGTKSKETKVKAEKNVKDTQNQKEQESENVDRDVRQEKSREIKENNINNVKSQTNNSTDLQEEIPSEEIQDKAKEISGQLQDQFESLKENIEESDNPINLYTGLGAGLIFLLSTLFASGSLILIALAVISAGLGAFGLIQEEEIFGWIGGGATLAVALFYLIDHSYFLDYFLSFLNLLLVVGLQILGFVVAPLVVINTVYNQHY